MYVNRFGIGITLFFFSLTRYSRKVVLTLIFKNGLQYLNQSTQSKPVTKLAEYHLIKWQTKWKLLHETIGVHNLAQETVCPSAYSTVTSVIELMYLSTYYLLICSLLIMNVPVCCYQCHNYHPILRKHINIINLCDTTKIDNGHWKYKITVMSIFIVFKSLVRNNISVSGDKTFQIFHQTIKHFN